MDASTGDDAAVYRFGDSALVATVDFFTPIVDDAFDFGRIAAANALSDVYAMGGRPLLALNLLGFPRRLLGEGLVDEMVRGAGAVAREAGVALIGGHSIDQEEPHFGWCVVGSVEPDRMLTHAGARAGDALILTKPLGTGVISTAIKDDAAPAEAVTAAVASMTTLNRDAARAAVQARASAATDVTGFGLIGHLSRMCQASGVGADLRAGAVPLLPAARALAEAGHVPGGTTRNRRDFEPSLQWDAGVDETSRTLLCDAQTSGGLLIAIPEERAADLLSMLEKAGTPTAARIGSAVDGDPGHIRITP